MAPPLFFALLEEKVTLKVVTFKLRRATAPPSEPAMLWSNTHEMIDMGTNGRAIVSIPFHS